MATEREVLEFIIVPPFEQRAAVAAAKERFENYLANRFPGYSFRVGPFAPVGDEDEFSVLPLMNFLGDDGKSYMCVPPKRWFVSEIADACKQFDMRGLRHFAA
ncbi:MULTISPECIES: hypothetical protein [Rhizobium]|uniref:hypothetical protein n=1 Tax=Rhizobium TaxID=379 RepID=UPI00102FB50B|nr:MULTISPECIES: hypothetical protein [Rhizobium]MBY3228576.1 hypothetical protein [Rhizobium laguerreae]TAY66522.1 hypothetical protein ELH82_10125 [Rhizobium leguminosarum]TBF35448.1 hypothetical protein ELG88_09595 [Rhizobium leguminosarum]